MRISTKTLAGLALAVILAALISTAGTATAQLGAAGQVDPPCRGTWWVERGSLQLGEKLPEFGFSKCDGEELTTTDLEGQPVLINFWATWCGPCREELPDLNELAEEAGDSLRVVGVSLDRDPGQLHEFVKQAMLDFEVTWDGGGIARDLGITTIPFTLAIDAEGNLVGGHRGLATKDQFIELAKTAGAELPETDD
jgi:thiol-disulfide isomerase/thioredoxin